MTDGSQDSRLSMRTVEIMGVDFAAVTEAEACGWILERIRQKVGGMIITANLDFLRRCRRDTTFRALVKTANLVVADGMPIVWASRLKGTPLPARVPGSTMSVSLCCLLAKEKKSLFLLGGNPGVANQAAIWLSEQFDGLNIVGSYSPPFGFENDEHELNRIGQLLESKRPDVIYVALGSPKQELLANRLLGCAPHAQWIGVGVSLSFITGDVVRAPLWMQRTGLEWLHRLKQEPKRLAKRYLVDGIPFACQLLASSALARFRQG